MDAILVWTTVWTENRDTESGPRTTVYRGLYHSILIQEDAAWVSKAKDTLQLVPTHFGIKLQVRSVLGPKCLDPGHCPA